MADRATQTEARRRVVALAFHVIGDLIKHGEAIPSEAKDLLAFT